MEHCVRLCGYFVSTFECVWAVVFILELCKNNFVTLQRAVLSEKKALSFNFEKIKTNPHTHTISV